MEPVGGSSMDGLTIGKLAHLAGVGVETVRYYERENLLVRPIRVKGQSRVYPQDAVTRLRFIRKAKDLGFSLAEIRELLEFGTNPETACCQVRARAHEKMADIDSQLAALGRKRDALQALAALCPEAAASSCAFLEALESDL
jgi:MerR family mercuric resistance operon transcriptional regulator